MISINFLISISNGCSQNRIVRNSRGFHGGISRISLRKSESWTFLVFCRKCSAILWILRDDFVILFTFLQSCVVLNRCKIRLKIWNFEIFRIFFSDFACSCPLKLSPFVPFLPLCCHCQRRCTVHVAFPNFYFPSFFISNFHRKIFRPKRNSSKFEP